MDAWLHEAWTTVVSEFSDLSDASQLTRLLLRLGVALTLGGLIGVERERRGHPAGLRTHMLVALGAALFTFVPLEAGFERSDVSRVLQGLVSGIGFLGAGAIIKLSATRQVQGLTTAASIWTTAAIGVAAGLGRETTAVVTTLVALAILAVLRPIERRIGSDDARDGQRNDRGGAREEE
ncbi:MgtC/SapB family protein [Chitinasiproducens palmae]|uniref:Protein MgtC n=1 Tax=Chitinasiproducens palmae TaxID=1770053 RepID=A0A1H2PSQ8_9BURK|nr:putative Mg2+ transporter-C (MgtC) family protein [Chitinasiproducens palmae]